MFRAATAGLIALVALSGPAAPREAINHEINARIRKEGRDNSHIMRTMHFLTDVHGPRLTGSPNFRNAAEWAVKQMTDWGFANGRLEPWDFGRPGWLNERFSGFIVAPVNDTLVGEVLAWTPSTNGTVTADAIQVVPPPDPTEPELNAWIAETSPKVKGRIVLVGNHTPVPVTITKAPLRRDYDDLVRQYDPNAPQAGPPRGGPAAGPQRGGGPAERPRPGVVAPNVVNERVDVMLVASGALVRLNDAGRDHGQIRAFHNRTST